LARGGAISGKYAPECHTGRQQPRRTSGQAHSGNRNGEWNPCALLSRFSQYTQGRGVGMVEFAIAWVLNNSAVDVGDCRAAVLKNSGMRIPKAQGP